MVYSIFGKLSGKRSGLILLLTKAAKGRTINGRRVYFVQVGEKGTAWSKLQAAGHSCHGSVPTMGDNAVLK